MFLSVRKAVLAEDSVFAEVGQVEARVGGGFLWDVKGLGHACAKDGLGFCGK